MLHRVLYQSTDVGTDHGGYGQRAAQANFHTIVTYRGAPLCYYLSMSEATSIPEERPSAIGSFFKGALSSALSGALMAGIVALVTVMLPGGIAAGATFGPAFWKELVHIAPLMISATGLFGGIMAAKRAVFDAPAVANAPVNYVPVPVQSLSGPAIAPTIAADRAVDSDSPSTNWVEKTRRTGDNAQRQIDAILARGAANDGSRASAVLAAREASANQERSVS